MAIKIKAQERNVSFQEGVKKYAYVLQADLYNKLSQAKVIQEAALRSGISKGAINAAWDAIGEVIKAWATEGHSVAVPGLGSMRFGIPLQVGCSKQTSKTYTFFAYSFTSFDNQIRGKVDISPFFDMAMPACFQSFFEIEIDSSGFVSKMKT